VADFVPYATMPCNYGGASFIILYVMVMLTIGYLHNRVFMLVAVGAFG
jgi:SNF family Na+-dependent transporter